MLLKWFLQFVYWFLHVFKEVSSLLLGFGFSYAIGEVSKPVALTMPSPHHCRDVWRPPPEANDLLVELAGKGHGSRCRASGLAVNCTSGRDALWVASTQRS